ETLMPAVNGHVLSFRLLQASRSTSSFTPAATIDGANGLIATAGSFCLFCGNVVDGLPLVTSVSDPYGVAAASPDATAMASAKAAAVPMSLRMSSPPSLVCSNLAGRDSTCGAHSLDGLCAEG